MSTVIGQSSVDTPPSGNIVSESSFATTYADQELDDENYVARIQYRIRQMYHHIWSPPCTPLQPHHDDDNQDYEKITPRKRPPPPLPPPPPSPPPPPPSYAYCPSCSVFIDTLIKVLPDICKPDSVYEISRRQGAYNTDTTRRRQQLATKKKQRQEEKRRQ